MNYSTLEIKQQGHIAQVVLNRPDAMNSMTPDFWVEFPAAIRAIDNEGSARVIVISSTGKHFSAGMDLSVFLNMKEDFKGDPSRRAERMRRTVKLLQDSFTALEEARMPVIGAVQGGAIGGAVDLLSACDMRYCTDDAFFTIKETQLGMTADVGTLQRLPKLIPIGLVKELAYTGRNFGAQEAKQLGFVNKVFDNTDAMLEGVMEVAQQIAANSPLAVAGTKTMINYAVDHSVAESLNYMATWQAGMFQMEDVFNAMQAQKTKTIPDYPPLHGAVTSMKS
ncbi:crotonase/enoyl-CoA hydratase family protein [Alteromonas sp. 345S023]|uniref:Crotonase/enoyl-CoA hydratase family protein n=1 Tax=Alteromonas profundi TaxID=2696062 RepID=A0A7X5LM63_9ALTE|nr:crotonase/enoyl-CoA hydratase family protein [Alteromonas profundi]NDV91931.1 crotonase/enoyl-CoA hydratase family protein [Alteromonas profundi]